MLSNYEIFGVDALWFLGAELAVVLAGSLNVAPARGERDRLVRALCHATHALFAALFAAAALFILPEPQVFFGALLFAAAAASGFILRGRVEAQADAPRTPRTPE